jgi:hypothetical protein
MDAAEKPQVLPPSKVKKAADAVLNLTRQGYTCGWGEREALLTKVRELTGDKSLSIISHETLIPQIAKGPFQRASHRCSLAWRILAKPEETYL